LPWCLIMGFTPFTNARGWARQAARDKYLPVCNADGGMSHERFSKVLRIAGVPEEEIGVITSTIDRSYSGLINLEEFLDFLGYEMEPEVLEPLPVEKADTCAAQMADVMQTDEGRAALKAFFDTLDKDGNGKVSSKEWGKALGQQKELMAKYFGGSTPAEIGQAFKRIDANGDGNLTWEEFVAASEAKGAEVETGAVKLAEAMQTDDGKADLKAFFDTLDKDGDGKVSSKEWGKALGKNKEVMAKYFGGNTPAEIGQAFKLIDENGDPTFV